MALNETYANFLHYFPNNFEHKIVSDVNNRDCQQCKLSCIQTQKIQIAALVMNIANTNFKEPLIVNENLSSNYLSLLKIEIEGFTIIEVSI
jgi:hypothetical protein